MHRKGFGRFCSTKYTGDAGASLFVHLTNVSKQKHSAEYNPTHGGKWPLGNLLLFLEATRGRAAAKKLIEDIKRTIVLSMRAVQHLIVQDRHCFELYGYDVLIDNTLKPWLIEVNASPSLTSTTPDDLQLKCDLIDDVFVRPLFSLPISLEHPRFQIPTTTAHRISSCLGDR